MNGRIMGNQRRALLGVAAISAAGLTAPLSGCDHSIALAPDASACNVDSNCTSTDAGSPDSGDAAPVVSANLLVDADFPTSVFVVRSASGSTFGYASAAGVFVTDLAETPRQFIGVKGLEPGRKPWRVDTGAGAPTIAAGYAHVINLSDKLNPQAVAIAIPGGAAHGTGEFPGDSNSAPAKLWAVPNGPEAGVYRSLVHDAAVAKLNIPFGPSPAASATAIFVANSEFFLVGDASGNLRACMSTTCVEPRQFGTRVDAFASNPGDLLGPYALLGDAVVLTRIALGPYARNIDISSKSAIATETAGLEGPGGYYAHAIAAGQHCVYFSSRRGLEWAREAGDKLEGGVLVSSGGSEFLGVALGPAPHAGTGSTPRDSVYFTVFAPRERSAGAGGVYFVDEPPQCTSGGFRVGGSVRGDASDAPIRVMLNGTGPFSIPPNGPFVLPNELPDGTDYNVALHDAPGCGLISGGTGRIQGAHVHTVRIQCVHPG